MFLLKCTIKGLSPFQAVFNTLSEAEKYVSTISPDSIDDYSIHPLFIQDAVVSHKVLNNPNVCVSVQYRGDGHPKPYKRDISMNNLYDLVFKDFDFTDVYKIVLFPDARR